MFFPSKRLLTASYTHANNIYEISEHEFDVVNWWESLGL
jgi:hypothetical protein